VPDASLPSSEPAAAEDSPGGSALGPSLGRAIREARTARKLSMRALASASDISQPFLSQIESGQSLPSISTLYRIANVLGISPAGLLPSEPEPGAVSLTRAADAAWVPIAETEGAGRMREIAAVPTRFSEHIVEPGEHMGDWFRSDGEQTVYVVEGTVTVEIEGRGSWDLGPGDAITHPGALRNRWIPRPGERARLLLLYTAAE